MTTKNILDDNTSTCNDLLGLFITSNLKAKYQAESAVAYGWVETEGGVLHIYTPNSVRS